MVFGAFSPSAKVMASSMLLLPEPFGPDIATRPGSRFITVFLYPNDLKPNISTLRI